MPIKKGTKSQHDHNNSLLNSKRPKFREYYMEKIHVDKLREDSVPFVELEEKELKKVMTQIKANAQKEFYKELKILGISILITAVILIYLNDYLNQLF